MPALHGRLPPRRGGAGVRKPPGKETASRKDAYQNKATPDFVAQSLMNFRRIIAN